MKVNKFFSSLTSLICAAALTVLILCAAVRIPTFFHRFYSYEYTKNGTYATVNMYPQDLANVTAHMLDYMRDKNDDLQILTKVGGDTRGFFSNLEIKHMKDVKLLFNLLFFAEKTAAVCLSLCIFLLTFVFRKKWHNHFLAVCGTLLTAFALVAVACIINFEGAFTIFHKIFFNNDDWILDSRVDLLVNIVPTEFFIDIAAFVGILFLILFASCWFVVKKLPGILILPLSLIYTFTVFNVLKTAAISTAIILASILILAIIVLFSPVRYEASYTDGGNAPTWRYKINLLYGMLRLMRKNGEQGITKILFFTKKNGKTNGSENEDTDMKEKTQTAPESKKKTILK